MNVATSETTNVDPLSDERKRLRWTVYTLLIAVSVGGMVGRILAVNSVDRIGSERVAVSNKLSALRKQLAAEGLSDAEVAARVEEATPAIRAQEAQQRPFLSANDRSRWATVRSLVELGTYEIDEIIQQRNWDTIDMVQHKGRFDDERHLYSSKPPLLATLVACEYWLIHRITGLTLQENPYEIGRFMLITINVIPLIVYFLLLAAFAERFGRTDWGRMFMMAATCFATYLSTFAVTLNNHLLAAISVAIAMHCAWRIWYDGERRFSYFALTGLFAAFAATNDLPALSLFGLLSLGMLWIAPRPFFFGYVPASLVVAAAFVGTTFAAHGQFKLPYMTFGKEDSDNWYDYEYVRKSDGRVIQSYWRNPAGIDKGEPSKAVYALHATVGHHGIFSLTPIWLLSLASVVVLSIKRKHGLQTLALMIAVLSIICITFYLNRPQDQRNYGGMTSGFRWVFWLTPLWLMMLQPAADYLADCKWKRGLGLFLLAWSVMSVAYPVWNPWTHPWFTNFMIHYEWIKL